MLDIFYVYILFDFLGIPFYVGKGKGSRHADHARKTDNANWLKNEIIEQTWIVLGEIPTVLLDRRGDRKGLNETEAFELEILLIKAIGRLDLGFGPLVNLTDGGDGASGHKMTISSRQRLREFNLGKRHNTETRRKISTANRNRPPISDETRKRRSLALRGLKRTPEARANISNAAKNKPPQSEETKLKISASVRLAYQEGRRKPSPPNYSNLGKTLSPETRAKISASKLGKGIGRKHAIETRTKISEANKKTWIKRRVRLISPTEV